MNEQMYYQRYDNVCSIHRDEYKTRKDYINDYREHCKKYPFKVRVEGGWMFFAYADDYETWNRQK